MEIGRIAVQALGNFDGFLVLIQGVVKTAHLALHVGDLDEAAAHSVLE